jgi:predicted phage replisome organizer
MSTNKKYYYIKLKEYFFDEPVIRVLEADPEGDKQTVLLLKLYLMSLKYNGLLLLGDDIPLDIQTIALLTHNTEEFVERTFRKFIALNLMERSENGGYYMTNIQLYIGQSSSEAERKKIARQKLKAGENPEVSCDGKEENKEASVDE